MRRIEMQLELFDTETHVHVYKQMQGPHVRNPEISVGGTDSRWCWSCASWVNRVGVSQWEEYQYGTEAIAKRYALMIKGGMHRSDAAHLFNRAGRGFFEALLAIDIAIGELNAGEE
jgi:hypothetical protein